MFCLLLDSKQRAKSYCFFHFLFLQKAFVAPERTQSGHDPLRNCCDPDKYACGQQVRIRGQGSARVRS